MIEELNNVIEKRVKEVLQFHLNGTTEEFDAAAMAVMGEFVSMGSRLSGIVSDDLNALTNPEGRESLAEKLTNALNDN